mgnify:CR=1 FL=1
MKNVIYSITLVLALTATAVLLPTTLAAGQQANEMDIYAGHFSMEGNKGSATRATNHNIYIKFFEGQWIVTLYIPHPYADGLDPQTITDALEQVKKQTAAAAYLKGEFGRLEKSSIASVERFGYLEDRLVFECNSLAPCTIKLNDGFLEMIKPGVINEHIIKFDHVTND